MKFIHYISIAIIFLVSGCTGHISTIGDDGESFMYELTEELADEIILNAMGQSFGSYLINPVTLPSRGYTSTMKILLDRHTVTAIILPAKGVNNEGNEVFGFAFSVDHHGTMPITGGGKARAVFRNINSMASAITPALTMTEIIPRSQIKQATKSVETSKGTCFVVDPNGFVVTNFHIIEGGSLINVFLKDGSRLAASTVAESRNTDLAILKIPADNLNYISFTPPKNVNVGDEVFTMGFPVEGFLGAEPKFTDGVISSLSGVGNDSTFYQITVPVQPGNSGGPLVNQNGEVVGIVTSTAAIEVFYRATGSLPQNVNFAVKSELATFLFESSTKLPPTTTRREAIQRTSDALCRIEVSR